MLGVNIKKNTAVGSDFLVIWSVLSGRKHKAEQGQFSEAVPHKGGPYSDYCLL